MLYPFGVGDAIIEKLKTYLLWGALGLLPRRGIILLIDQDPTGNGFFTGREDWKKLKP